MGAFETKPKGPELFSGPLLLLFLIVFLLCIFGIRLWYLQVYKNEFYENRSQDNRTRLRSIFSSRGFIRDQNGILLAENAPAYSLALIREDCPDIDKTLDQVAVWTGFPRDELGKAFELGKIRTKYFEEQILVSNIPFDVVATVETHLIHWPGLHIAVRPRRDYAYANTLAHVLGYVARANEDELRNDPSLHLGDDVGKQGVEYVLERQLRGKKGFEEFEVDATGRTLSSQVLTQPVAGEDLVLSISLPLQEAVTKALDGKVGAVVVMDADTGRIVAQVSLPSYNPNDFVTGISHAKWDELQEDPFHPLQNRPIQSSYPPGSIFKLVVAAQGLEKGTIKPSTLFFCSGKYKLGQREFRCWKRGGHGSVDFWKSLRESCDVYYYQLGERMGVDSIHEFATQCGFGERTGIELPHERTGLMPSSAWKLKRHGEKWQGGETLNFSIGQGYTLTTPIQVARFVSALVNGGKLLRPTLLQSGEPEVQGLLPMSEGTRQLIVKAMVATVEEDRGTARTVRRPGIRIGGKTGTAQVVKLLDKFEKKKTHEIPYKYRDHAWIACFGERDGRRYSVTVMLEHGGSGGSDAGPVAGAVFDAIFTLEPEAQGS